jgi:hypothetical protein
MSCDQPPPPELLEGIAQFNRGEFFEQHETPNRAASGISTRASSRSAWRSITCVA